MVRPPREVQERSLRVEQAIAELTSEAGRAPTVPEVAQRAGLELEEALEALQAGQARHGVSLDAPQGHGPDEHTVADTLGRLDAGFAAIEDRTTLTQLGRSLTARERTILQLRFDEDLTQAEIGERVGLSQMQVSRIIRHAIERLRATAQPAG